jgi:hypothetical protein
MLAISATACSAVAALANEVAEDLFGFLRMLSDSTVLRSLAGLVFCLATFPDSHPVVQWKEAVYDKAKNLRVRMFKLTLTPTSDAASGLGDNGS